MNHVHSHHVGLPQIQSHLQKKPYGPRQTGLIDHSNNKDRTQMPCIKVMSRVKTQIYVHL